MTETITLVNNPNQETCTIVGDLLNRLSVEAKFVLYKMFNTPDEFSQLMFGGEVPEEMKKDNWILRTRVNKKRVYNYLKLLGWATRDINKTIFAIKEFTRELQQLR